MPLLRLYHITGQIGWFTNTPKPGEDYTGTYSVDEKLWAKSKTSAESGILEMLRTKNKWVECWWLTGRKVIRVVRRERDEQTNHI